MPLELRQKTLQAENEDRITPQDHHTFKNKVTTLLQAELKTKRIIGIMSLYGRLYYDWDIHSDLIQWRGPASVLFGTKSNRFSGNVFLRRLSFEDFDHRLRELGNCFKNRKSFEIEYHLGLGDGLYGVVHENAEMLFTQNGIPAKILGSIKILPQAFFMKPKPEESLDRETNLASSSELEKLFSAAIAKSQKEQTYGAYLTLAIDKITRLAALAGENAVKVVTKFIVETLKKNVRSDDALGRIAGNSFGLILYNCDRWGIVSASERLLGKIQEIHLQIDSKAIDLSLSSGGIVFPYDTLDPKRLMQISEEVLEESQNSQGISRFWGPSLMRGENKKSSEKQVPEQGKRRFSDLSTPQENGE